jgi:hypothetical protein
MSDAPFMRSRSTHKVIQARIAVRLLSTRLPTPAINHPPVKSFPI